jgi:hypothetical protein
MAQREETAVEGVTTVLSIALRREEIPFWDLIAGRACLDRSAGSEFEIHLTKAETSESSYYKVLV